MGYVELIAALRRDGEEQLDKIRSDAEREAERVKGNASARIERLKAEYAGRLAPLEAAQARTVLADAESRASSIRLAAESALAKRLFLLARSSLHHLRDEGYDGLFADLVRELPSGEWRQVVVNPADMALAARHFPDAEITPDPAVVGGLEVSEEGRRISVVNTLEKRGERAWPELLPDILRDIYREL